MPPQGWVTGFTLTSDHVWDGFIILSLLEDHQNRQQPLVVPHSGQCKDRYTEAVQAHNLRIQLYGQPEIRHYCKKCTRTYTDADGKSKSDFPKLVDEFALMEETVDRKVSVAVIDGITIGHPCCASHNCHEPLKNNRHRYCTHHQLIDKECAIVGCNRFVPEPEPNKRKSQVCDDPEHQEIERVRVMRGQARFQLKDRLLRQRVAHPNDSTPQDVGTDDVADVEDPEEEFLLDENGRVFPDAVQAEQTPDDSAHRDGTMKRKVRAQFGRKRTHNEQIIVAPCGTIIARVTFFGAEAVSSVVVPISHPFLPPTMF